MRLPSLFVSVKVRPSGTTARSLPLRSIFAPSEATSLTSSDGLPHGTIPTWPQRPNGKEVRPASFYSERYLDAFPVLLRGLEPSEYFSPFEWLQSEYEHQALAMYADMCGFIRYTSADWRAKTLATVTVLPLMDDVAAFMV